MSCVLTPISNDSEIGDAITKGYPIRIHPLIAKRVEQTDEGRRYDLVSFRKIGKFIRELHWGEIVSATNVNTTAMSLYRLLDDELIEIFEPFRPCYNIPDMNNPYGISNATKAQPNQAATLANWLYGGHDKYNTVKR